MKLIVLIFLTVNLFGQTVTKRQIDRYVKIVDSLRISKKLKKYSYPEMSLCGGALYGYYQNTKLIFIDATHGGEFGANSYKMYFKDTLICKIQYQEYWGDQNAYAKIYPKDEDINEKKLTYTDTLYTIYITTTPIYVKSSRGKVISTTPNQNHIDELIKCGQIMRRNSRHKKTAGNMDLRQPHGNQLMQTPFFINTRSEDGT